MEQDVKDADIILTKARCHHEPHELCADPLMFSWRSHGSHFFRCLSVRAVLSCLRFNMDTLLGELCAAQANYRYPQ